MKDIKSLLDGLNKELKKSGMLELDLVNPKDCLPQKINARYMTAETMHQLTDNIKNDGHLESTPLVYRDAKKPEKYRIISGHHRVDAAKAAGLESILVMIAVPKNTDEIITKQLSHNALSGLDDKTILHELFNSIQEVEQKIRTGLMDEAGSINYTSLNFRIGTFKEFTVMFLPEDIGLYDEAVEDINKIIQESGVKPTTDVRLSSVQYYEEFKNSIIKLKKVENIKSNGVALMRMVELANEQMMQNGLHEETEK